MTVSQEIDKRLARLKSADPKTRDLAAAEIGDYLEADRLSPPCLQRAVHTLMTFAFRESDETARESIFNALSIASECSDTSGIDWGPIAARLDELPVDCLEHALVILGFSGNPKYRTKIRSFLSHPDESIRATAADSMAMLASDGLKSAQRRT